MSDLFTRFLTGGGLFSTDAKRVCECFRVDAGGDGRRVDGKKADGSLACDLDGRMDVVRLARVGSGRLLNVRLRGIPPIGSSGKQI